MTEGDPLKPIHDALGTIADGLAAMVTAIRNIKEQLHAIDGSQTRLTEIFDYDQ